MNDSTETINCQFAFSGKVGKVLEKYFLRDKSGARLSRKFQIYYRLRPYIPTLLRRLIQRSRNRSLEISPDWYLQVEFLDDLKNALGQSDLNVKVVHPWPEPHRMAISLTHDIETADGQKLVDGIAKMEENLGLRSAWFFIPYKYKVDRGLVDDLKRRGHEVGIHGYNHDGRLFASRSIFDYRTGYINRAAHDLGSAGFRAPMVHRNLDWMQQLEFDYDASCFDIDPFQAMPGGVGGVWPFIAGKLVELPYTLPQDHTLLITLGETTPRIWIRKLEMIRRLHGMALLVTHPDYLDVPERLKIYTQFCEHVAIQNEAWRCLPGEIACWWRERMASVASMDNSNSTLHSLSSPDGHSARLVKLGEILGDLSVPSFS